jgi:hypothetical protein
VRRQQQRQQLEQQEQLVALLGDRPRLDLLLPYMGSPRQKMPRHFFADAIEKVVRGAEP